MTNPQNSASETSVDNALPAVDIDRIIEAMDSFDI